MVKFFVCILFVLCLFIDKINMFLLEIIFVNVESESNCVIMV